MGLLALAVLAGCGMQPVDSGEVATGDIFMDAVALAPGDGTTLVRAHVNVAGERGMPIRLTSSDELLVRVGDESPMSLSWVDDGVYERRFSREASSPLELSFQRSARGEPASFAWAILPPPFFVELVGEGPFSRDTPVRVRWSGRRQDTVSFELSGPCIQSREGKAPDSGQLELGPERLAPLPRQRGRRCEVELVIERESRGRLEGNLAPQSRFGAIQRRRVTFVSTPAEGESEP